MFHVLLESAARTPRRAGWTLGSTVMHASVVTAALVLTMRDKPPAVESDDILVIAHPFCCWPAPATPGRSGAPLPGPLTLPEVVIPDAPLVGIQTDVSVSFDYPIDSVGPGILRDAFLRHGQRLDPGLYPENLVDRAVIPRAGNRWPEYPQSLRASMVEGEVLLQFVVDTTGRVEQQSISILRSSHVLFEESARRWLSRTRYMPAQLGGQAVRQLVHQQIAFTLDR